MSIGAVARVGVLAGAASLLASGAFADVFVQVDGVPGDARIKGMEQQIFATGASLSVMSNPVFDENGVMTGASTPIVSSVTVMKRQDRASPKIIQAAVQGEELGEVVITFTSPGRTSGSQEIDAKWILEGAKINSLYMSGGASPGDPTTESVEISYRTMKVQHFMRDDKGARTGAMEEVTVEAPDPSLQYGPGC